MPGEDNKILVVDDEQSVADAYTLRLASRYDTVETAYGGEDALEFLADNPDVDLVLLDRRMPDIAGDEVLDEIRERGYDCRVIMVTAVNADFDVLEMPFDDYLQKPIEKDDLFDAVDQQLSATDYEDKLSEYYSISSKISLLETEKTPAELEDNEEYQELKRRSERLEADLDDAIDEFDDMSDAFMSIGRG